MTSLRFNYRWAIAVIAVAAITLTQSLYPATSARPLARTIAADLTTEKQALTTFADSLGSLEKKVAELQLKSSITATELNTTKTSASSLKTKVSPLGQTFQSVINKLKASGEWENFDDTVLRRIANDDTQALIRDAGGAKKILQDAVSQLSALSTEIDALVQPLNSRVASTGPAFGNHAMLGFMPARASLTHAATAATKSPTATAAFIRSAKCLLSAGIFIVVGSPKSDDRMNCNCPGRNPSVTAAACAALAQ